MNFLPFLHLWNRLQNLLYRSITVHDINKSKLSCQKSKELQESKTTRNDIPGGDDPVSNMITDIQPYYVEQKTVV